MDNRVRRLDGDPGRGRFPVSVLGLAPMAVTSELYISFLRPAKGGDLVARAEILRVGKTKISGVVRVWVEGAPDRTVSHVTGSYVHLG